MEMADTPYIIFLDPDDEAICDGYAKLYEKLEANADCGFAMGNTNILGKKGRHEAHVKEIYKKFADIDGSDIMTVGKSLITDSNFYVYSMQSMVIRADFCKRNDLKFVVGAYGEDTLFYYQMLHCAKKIICADVMVRMYYTAVESSVTNIIGVKFFERALLGEVQTIDFFKKNGYIKSYVKNRFTDYFFEWLIEPRFAKIKDFAVMKECAGILMKYIKNIISTGHKPDKRIHEFYNILKREEWHKITPEKF